MKRERAIVADALRFRRAHLHGLGRGARRCSRCCAAVEREWALMFLLLGVALFVDGIDGMFARRLDVAQRLPRWSGDTLDLVVDFLTYVFVPAYVVVGERPAAAPRWRSRCASRSWSSARSISPTAR